MIGKILADRWGWTKKLGGTENETIHITTKVNNKELDKLKKDIQDCNTTAQVDVVIKEHGLSDIEGLPEHIKEVYEKGEIDKLKLSDVNKFALNQRYNDIADQAHGILGVKKAIDKYNEGIENGILNTDKFNEIIGQSNSSLGNYLTGLKGTTGGIFDYGKSLATATIKTFALETATMALNTAVSFGASIIISGIITAITNYVNRVDDAIEASHQAKETIDEANSTFKEQQNLIKESGRNYAELAQHVNQLNNTNLDLKEDEYEEFLDLSNQIAEQFPSLVKGYDDNGNAILNLNGTVGDINSTLDTYIEKAKKASQIKIVQAFKGDGDNEDYFKGAKYEVDESKNKANEANKRKENLQKIQKPITLPKNDTGASIGRYQQGTDARLKAETVREYLKDSGLSKKLPDILNSLSNSLTQGEYHKLFDAINGGLTDSALLDIDEILSKHPEESGYNFSDYITQQIQSASEDYEQFATDVETKNKEISQNAQVVLEQSAVWSNPDTTDRMKDTMTNAINKIDWSDAKFEGFDGKQAAHYVQTVFASSFEKLSPDDKITVDKFFNADPNKMDLTEYISLYEKIKEIFEKQGIKIPINIEDSKKVENDFNKSLEQMSDKDKETVKKYLNDNGIDSASELYVWNKRTEGITNATDAIEAYERKAQEVSQKSPKSFDEVWDSADSKEKKKLEELAEAGKLTKEKLKNSSLAKEFTKAGVSIEEATDKINKMKSSVTQLASMKTGISSISSILGQKEENLSNKKTKKQGIGIDTLEAMPDDVKSQTAEYEHFVEVLGNGKSTMNDCKDAANKLATAYVNSNNFLANLTDETGKCDEKTKQYYTSVLKEMGVENAATVVKQSLAQKNVLLATKKEFLESKGKSLENATWNEIEAFMNEKHYSDEAKNAIYLFALQKELANGTTLDVDSDIDAIIRLVKNLGGATSALRQYQSIKNGDYYVPSDVEKAIGKTAQDEIDKAFKKGKKKTKIKIDPINTSRDKGTGKDPKSDNKSNSKQTFDWIERRLNNLQRVIDLTAAKFQNIFQIGKQKSNLDKQIKTTKQLIKEYGLAAEKYQTKANKIAAGKKVKGKKGKKKKVKNKLSKGIIKKIKTGKLTKKTKVSSLIKAYGSDKAEQIQSYIDYYDKAQSAKKSKVEQITKQRELKQQKLQLDVDLYNERISRAEAKEAVAIGAKKKNASVNKQIKNIQLSYDKQIAIAKLTKGEKSKAEIDRLKYEKQKKITDLKVHQIDNIKKDYENKISPFDNAKQKTQNEVSLLEAKGRIVTANYYRKQNDQETNKRNTLQNELKELQGKLKSGTFTEYSDEWYPYTKTALDLHHFYTISLKKYAKL